MLRRTISRFSTLRWKLTFSYTWVTVATLLTFELLLIIFALVFLGSNLFINVLLDNLKTEVNAFAGPILAENPPNIDTLEIWMDSLINEQTQINITGSVEQSDQLQIGSVNLSNANQFLIILDNNQSVLAQIPHSNSASEYQSNVTLFEEPATQMVIERALVGETENASLAKRLDRGGMVTAVPIQHENQQVGVAVLTFQLPRFSRDVLLPVIQVVLITTIPLTLGAIFIGTIFGFFTSRGITRRIKTMTNAAEAWSQGDFSVVAHDASGDELGHLSRRLNQMAEQLQNLLDTSQELASVEERNRLARDLHDSIKQQLFATTMQLGAAINLFEEDSDAAKTHLATAEQLANRAQKELTGLIQELRPAALDGRGLPEALRTYLNDWSSHTGITANLRLQNEQGLPLAVEQPLFRVAQEALANIARHSQATSVDVHLQWETSQFVMTLQDDGVGFDTKTVETGIGLKSMQERLELINGRFSLSSTLDQGTTVQAIIPLQESSV